MMMNLIKSDQVGTLQAKFIQLVSGMLLHADYVSTHILGSQCYEMAKHFESKRLAPKFEGEDLENKILEAREAKTFWTAKKVRRRNICKEEFGGGTKYS